MVLQASATCGKPPATAFHYRMRAAAFALSPFHSPLPLSAALQKVCHDFSLSSPPPQHLLDFKRGITTRVLIQAPRFRRANIVLTLTRLKGYLPCMCAWRCTPINTWENRETNQTAVLKGCCADGRVGSRLFVFSFLR